MEYFTEVLDRRNGQVSTVSAGDWITITELGQLYGVGSRHTRTVLRTMEVLQIEGGGSQDRHRLAAWVVNAGWGRRIEKRGTVPFDVVGPELRHWIAARWGDAINRLEEERTGPSVEARAALAGFNSRRLHGALGIQEGVSWLATFFPHLTQAEMAIVLDVSQPMVARYVGIRRGQIAKLKELRKTSLERLQEEYSPGSRQRGVDL